MRRSPEGMQVSCNIDGRAFRADVVACTPTGVQIVPPLDCACHHVAREQVTAVHLPTAWDPAATQHRGDVL